MVVVVFRIGIGIGVVGGWVQVHVGIHLGAVVLGMPGTVFR